MGGCRRQFTADGLGEHLTGDPRASASSENAPAFRVEARGIATPEYRNTPRETERIANLLALVPRRIESALDIGARDGFISKLLAKRLPRVTALDLEVPLIDDDRIVCIKGDLRALDLPHASADLVVCSEVLEHIAPEHLATACSELSRVSRRYVLVGVPFKQDTRVGRTTCAACGRVNPPWGHVNRFDEFGLRSLFPSCEVARTSFVGVADPGTNALACRLMDLAGNPYGTYAQDEPCIHCGAALVAPGEKRTLRQRLLARAAVYAKGIQRPFIRSHANWIHVLFERKSAIRDVERAAPVIVRQQVPLRQSRP